MESLLLVPLGLVIVGAIVAGLWIGYVQDDGDDGWSVGGDGADEHPGGD